MIIKRGKSDITKNDVTVSLESQTVKTEASTSSVAKVSSDIPAVTSELNFEEINFAQRPERRQGSRRRGYRRIDDRNLISRAQEEADGIREQAVKEGHKLGLEKAEKDLEALNDAISEFFAYKEKVFDIVSPSVLAVAVEIAKKIINKEIEQDKTALLGLIKGALGDTFKHENRITVKVMPQDVLTVKENLPEFLSADQIEAKIKVVPDDKILSGGAIIVTENGIIDATIDTGLSILEQAFGKITQG